METTSKVTIKGFPKYRNIRVDCPSCNHSNFIHKIAIDTPPQKGIIECSACGANLDYQEII